MIIYQTTNLINGKKYIGKDESNNPSYLGSGVTLKKAIIKYGRYNFKKEILEYCINREHLNEREEYWLNKLNVADNSKYYNRINNTSGCKKGRKHSDETKHLMSLKRKGIKDSKQTKLIKSLAKKGKPSNIKGKQWSEESKNKMRKPKTQEHILKLKSPKSEKLKLKMSLAKKGKPSNRPKKPINQYDLQGNLIKEWNSIKEATDITNIKSIRDCLTGRQKQSGNYIWKYKFV
jgi:group I intron endonuclease